MKLLTMGALGIGFVLGARAGRERYEQIRSLAHKSAEQLEAYGADGSLAHALGSPRARSGAPTRRR